MKFLCVICDEPMKLKGAEGSGDNSVAIVFTCEKCGNSTAMITNPMETQLVKSLGVHVGGGAPYKPMEVIKGSLDSREEVGCSIPWDKEAETRLLNVPEFARPMARMGVVKYATEKGYKKVTLRVMDEARKSVYGM